MAKTAYSFPVTRGGVLAQVVDGAGADRDERVAGAAFAPDRRHRRRVGVGPAGHADQREIHFASQRPRHALAQGFMRVDIADQREPGSEVEARDQLGLAARERVGDRHRARRHAKRRPAVRVGQAAA